MDFVVDFYFVNSNQAQRTLAAKGLLYFSRQPKRFVYDGDDVAISANLHPLIYGGSGDAGPANPIFVYFI